MATAPAKSVFLLGTGYIGGSILQGLLNEGYAVTALSRSPDKAKELEKLQGVTTVIGSLDSEEVIVKAVLEHDIIIHAATADDLPSVKAILEGLSQRAESASPAVYIHTSGTGVLCQAPSPDIIYHDKQPEQIDSLPDSAWHRNVDLLIKNAVEGGKVGKAKVGIMLPPTIYGLGTGPLNKLSIDMPAWIRESLKNEQVTLYGPETHIWNDVHIKNLVPAYITLLSSLLSSPSQPSDGLYYFAETGTHTWHELGRHLHSVLSKRGLVKKEPKVDEKPAEGAAMGTYSRCKAERLKELGWEPEGATKQTIYEAVEDEVEAVLKE
ncbi:hypothetical protein BCR35DRAFT_300173 [Leucosporidium creatinivorum]|uniref:NAD(P)-binding domain-containing protein n=1 Tax=Leucosporidium creatinivorum TaxID=106004 RepID=A0A1Y2FZT9_9BASI|nr:hypothetical protein BCR35DRAFT_300173 [Leucosporidium creatinivorum]